MNQQLGLLSKTWNQSVDQVFVFPLIDSWLCLDLAVPLLVEINGVVSDWLRVIGWIDPVDLGRPSAIGLNLGDDDGGRLGRASDDQGVGGGGVSDLVIRRCNHVNLVTSRIESFGFARKIVI